MQRARRPDRLPVSVGIAPSKTLAKAANRLAKKGNGVKLLMTAAEQEAALATMELTDLWSVAGRMAKRLAAIGITTPLQQRDAVPQALRQHTSVVMERMALELRGITCIGLQNLAPAAKSIMCSRSFGTPVTRKEELQQAGATYTERGAAKVRSQNLATATMQVFVTLNPFKPSETQYAATKTINLPVAMSDTGKLAKAAVRAQEVVWRPDSHYEKAGVVLLDLIPAGQVQGDLWHQPDSDRRKSLMRTLDRINAEHGRGTLSLALSGRKPGGMRAEKRSPRIQRTGMSCFGWS